MLAGAEAVEPILWSLLRVALGVAVQAGGGATLRLLVLRILAAAALAVTAF